MKRALYVLLGVLLVPTLGLVGDIVTDGKFKSTLSTGAPIEVDSPDMVANLNADMVDGLDGTYIYSKAEVDAIVAAAIESARPRYYYLSWGTHTADDALNVCVAGYHMANMFELTNPSSLTYAVGVPGVPAHGIDDSGYGPPTQHAGWIRTGSFADVSNTIGVANCNVWTSASADDRGTVAFIPREWGESPLHCDGRVVGSIWCSLLNSCDNEIGVWCVEDWPTLLP